jgi:hypothetical protein
VEKVTAKKINFALIGTWFLLGKIGVILNEVGTMTDGGSHY